MPLSDRLQGYVDDFVANKPLLFITIGGIGLVAYFVIKNGQSGLIAPPAPAGTMSTGTDGAIHFTEYTNNINYPPPPQPPPRSWFGGPPVPKPYPLPPGSTVGPPPSQQKGPYFGPNVILYNRAGTWLYGTDKSHLAPLAPLFPSGTKIYGGDGPNPPKSGRAWFVLPGGMQQLLSQSGWKGYL